MAVKKNPGIINYEQLAFQHPTPFSARFLSQELLEGMIIKYEAEMWSSKAKR